MLLREIYRMLCVLFQIARLAEQLNISAIIGTA